MRMRSRMRMRLGIAPNAYAYAFAIAYAFFFKGNGKITSPMKLLLILFSLPAIAAGPMSNPETSGWPAEFLEGVCRGTFATGDSSGLLGRQVKKTEPDRLYQRLDPLLGGVVLVTSDGRGGVDPRPLGPKTVLECSFGGVIPKEGESDMCELDKGALKPLKQGDKRAKTRLMYQLVYNGELGSGANRVFEWQVSREFRLERRPAGLVLPSDVKKLKAMGRQVITPATTVPKFYRTDVQYWRRVTGDKFAINNGAWMQPYKDGNIHQVRMNRHLEEWPGEPEIMVEVKDEESWIKVGKGDSAFYLPEKIKKGPDWGGVYTNGDKPPANLRVSAAGACPACTGNQVEIPTSVGDLDVVPVEPE